MVRLPLAIRANICKALLATSGAIMEPPRTTSRTALVKSATDTPLSRYPDAPNRRALNTYSSSSNVVSTMTLIFGCADLISRVHSTPSTSGMRMSISTTSGLSLRTSSMASRPFFAMPTMVISLCAFKTKPKLSRISS